MSDFKPGLEGVVAFETEIAEPDKEGGSLRYRGVDIEELVGHVSFGHVWGLLVDNAFEPGLPPAEPMRPPGQHRRRAGGRAEQRRGARRALGPAPAARHLRGAGARGRRPGQRAAARVHRPVGARRRTCPPSRSSHVDEAKTAAEAFLVRWRGEPDPRHVKALDAYWVSAAEHGMNASTFTARVIASTGADVAAALSGAVGALSGPLHGGAPARVLHMIEEVERSRRRRRLREVGPRPPRPPDGLRSPGLPGGGPAGQGAAAHREGARRAQVRGRARAGERRARRTARAPAGPGARDQRRVLGGDRARLRRRYRADITPSMFTCARTAGWAAHIMEQKLTGRLDPPVRPLHRPGRPPGQGRGRRRSRCSRPAGRTALRLAAR